MLAPVRRLRSWTCAPSTGTPLASVTVPLTAPVVTPWARRRAEAPVTSAKAAATVKIRRVLGMLSRKKRGGGKPKLSDGISCAARDFCHRSATGRDARRFLDAVRRATLFCDEENRNSEENYAEDCECCETARSIEQRVPEQ